MQVRIPLVGSYNQRNVDVRNSLVTSGKDQRFRNCIPQVVVNPITKTATVAVYKRPGLASSTIASGDNGCAAFYSQNQSAKYEVFQNASTNVNDVYKNGVKIGSTLNTGQPISGINSTLINDKEYVFFVEIQGNASTNGWYHVEDATATSFTGDRTNGSAVVNNIASTTGLYAGQLISGTGFAAGTRILTVDSATQVTMNANASSGAPTSTNFTVDPLAKILDTDYPQYTIGQPVFDGGFAFVMDAVGNVWGSDINNITSWTTTNKFPCDIEPDSAIGGLFKIKEFILAGGSETTEVLRNAGNPAGSPLSRVQTLRIGVVAGVNAGDTAYLIGRTQRGVTGIYAFGEGLNKISTDEVDSILGYYQTSDTNAQSKLGYIVIGGQEALIIQAGSAPTFIYFIKSGFIAEWDFPAALAGNAHVSYYDAINRDIIFLGSTGKRYLMDLGTPLYQDEGSAYSQIVQLARQDFGTGNRKFLKWIELIADTQASGTVTLEISTDDFATFTTIGTFDLTKAKKIIYRCGSFVGGASLRLTHSANTANRMEALVVEYEVGTH